MSAIARLALLLVGVGAAGCRRPPSSAELAVEAWLTCVECAAAEVDSLRAAAAREPGIVGALREMLFEGPDASRRAQLEQQLRTSHDRLVARVSRDPTLDSLSFGRDEYVRRYLSKAERIYRGRAALGLGHVGGPLALAALDSALLLAPPGMPPTVRQSVQFARDSLLPH